MLLLVVGCSSSPSSNVASDAAAVPPEQTRVDASIPENTPEFQSASRFDRYVHGTLPDEEIQRVKSECRRSGNYDRFCSSYLNGSLGSRIRAKQLPPHSPEPKVIKPATITFRKGKIVNWNQLRREKIPPLLKAMNAFQLDEVRTIEKLALKEKRCPNAMAIVTGATLEDYLPERVSGDEIAALYEKAARCFPKGSSDRENFITRAGLLHYQKGNLKEACRLFASVKPADAFAGRSLYWAHRCAKESGDAATAESTFTRLTERYRFSFHALVAASTRGLDAGASILSDVPVAQKRSTKNQAINKQIESIELLRQCGFNESASILSSWTLDHFRKTEPEVKVYLAELGDASLQVTWIPQLMVVKPSLIQRETLQYAYPKAYFSYFEKQTGVDPFLLLALARKESRFDPKAISPTNAQGLLQIQPETASKLVPANSVNLLEPGDNIALGARYLSEVLGRLNGNLPLALAAYNAGEDAVKNWLFRYGNRDAILFIDLIPYRETRDYVAYVLANYFWYVRNYGQPTQDPIKKLIAITK
jgi:hypothetical protein